MNLCPVRLKSDGKANSIIIQEMHIINQIFIPFTSDEAPESLIVLIFERDEIGARYLGLQLLPLHIRICSSSKDNNTHGTSSCNPKKQKKYADINTIMC